MHYEITKNLRLSKLIVGFGGMIPIPIYFCLKSQGLAFPPREKISWEQIAAGRSPLSRFRICFSNFKPFVIDDFLELRQCRYYKL